MKRLVSLGTCLTLSLVLFFGFGTARSTLPASAQGEYVIFPETASVSSSGVTPLNFMLKAISKPSGDVEKVSGFKIDPLNVLSVSASGVISAISTDESMVFEQAKAKSSTDSLYELQKATIQGQQQPPSPQQPSNGFSIAGLAPGVYTLDLIGTKNGAKAAYEGILIIGQDKESPQVKQVVEKEIKEVEQDTTIVDVITIFQAPPQPQQPQPQPQLQPLTGPIAQQLQPSGGGAGPLGAQPQQLAAVPPGGQPNQPPSLTPSPPALPPSPSPQALGAQPAQCQAGFEGIPPQCTPIEPGNEPIDLLSLDPSLLDPNDPLFGEPGAFGETGDSEGTENLEDTDEGDSESDSESSDNEGDSDSEDQGDGGNGDSGDRGGDEGE